MKTKVFLAAIAGILLAGCVKVEMGGSKDNEVKNLITFDSPVTSKNVSTKANVHGEITDFTYGANVSYSYPREENFIIFAVKHDGDLVSWDSATKCLFDNDELEYDSMVDSWAPKDEDGGYYYWPDGNKLSFSAVSPADMETENTDVEISYTSTGLSIQNFTVPADPANHFDLMFSQRAANKTAANMNHTADAYSGIPLVFQHALSSIHFSVKKDLDVDEDVILKKITLKNAKNKGHFNENITEGSDAAAYVVGETGNVKPEWTVLSSTQEEYVSFEGSVIFPIEAQYVSSLLVSNEDNSGTAHPLLVMPQDLSDDVTIEITYTVGNAENKTKSIYLNQYPSGNPLTSWKLGYRYTYRLYYSKDTEKADIISFGPTTADWADGGIIEVKL